MLRKLPLALGVMLVAGAAIVVASDEAESLAGTTDRGSAEARALPTRRCEQAADDFHGCDGQA